MLRPAGAFGSQKPESDAPDGFDAVSAAGGAQLFPEIADMLAQGGLRAVGRVLRNPVQNGCLGDDLTGIA